MAGRIQFYPGNELMEKLAQEAARKGISITTLVMDILLEHCNATSVTSASGDMEAAVFAETRKFAEENPGVEFSLRDASPTFKSIENRSQKAHIGHMFNRTMQSCPNEPFFRAVHQVMNDDGTPKRSSHNLAALYIYIKEEDQ